MQWAATVEINSTNKRHLSLYSRQKCYPKAVDGTWPASCTGWPWIVSRLPSTLIVPSLLANNVWPDKPICANTYQSHRHTTHFNSVTKNLHCVPKKHPTLWLTISSPNINRFSKSFHWCILLLLTISNKVIMNIPPNTNCVATLPCEI